jgi:hypothetical protein
VQQPAREGLFQSGHDKRRISPLQPGKQKMDMLRHDHITDNYKLMALANLLHNFQEEVARAGCAEKRTPLIAAGSNEVRVSSAVVAVQICRPAKNTKKRGTHVLAMPARSKALGHLPDLFSF